MGDPSAGEGTKCVEHSVTLSYIKEKLDTNTVEVWKAIDSLRGDLRTSMIDQAKTFGGILALSNGITVIVAIAAIIASVILKN